MYIPKELIKSTTTVASTTLSSKSPQNSNETDKMMKILVDLSITILVAILSGLFTFLIKKFKIDVKFKKPCFN